MTTSLTVTCNLSLSVTILNSAPWRFCYCHVTICVWFRCRWPYYLAEYYTIRTEKCKRNIPYNPIRRTTLIKKETTPCGVSSGRRHAKTLLATSFDYNKSLYTFAARYDVILLPLLPLRPRRLWITCVWRSFVLWVSMDVSNGSIKGFIPPKLSCTVRLHQSDRIARTTSCMAASSQPCKYIT